MNVSGRISGFLRGKSEIQLPLVMTAVVVDLMMAAVSAFEGHRAVAVIIVLAVLAASVDPVVLLRRQTLPAKVGQLNTVDVYGLTPHIRVHGWALAVLAVPLVPAAVAILLLFPWPLILCLAVGVAVVIGMTTFVWKRKW